MLRPIAGFALVFVAVCVSAASVFAQCEPCVEVDPGYGVPSVGQCVALDVIVMGPRPKFAGNPVSTYIVHVENCLGALASVPVEIEFSPATMSLVAWCGAPPPPVSTVLTNAQGDAAFEFYGSGCVRAGDPNSPTPWVAEVRAIVDGTTYVLGHPGIGSPDAVNLEGLVPSVSGVSVCDNGVAAAGVSDAVFHTQPISMALVEPCSKVAPPYDGPVGVLDAVWLSQYLAAGSTCPCQ